MSDIYKGELQDNQGNTIYPHTEADITFCADGETVQKKLTDYENALGNVTGVTDSLEVNDSRILATSKALKKVNDSLTASDSLKFQFATDGEGNYGYLGADGSLVPFKGDRNWKCVLRVTAVAYRETSQEMMTVTDTITITHSNGSTTAKKAGSQGSVNSGSSFANAVIKITSVSVSSFTFLD